MFTTLFLQLPAQPDQRGLFTQQQVETLTYLGNALLNWTCEGYLQKDKMTKIGILTIIQQHPVKMDW
jgi:hypothetical protein